MNSKIITDEKHFNMYKKLFEHYVIQCFSTGGSRPRDRSEWVAECTAKETTSSTKNVILNVFLMRDFYFKRRA